MTCKYEAKILSHRWKQVTKNAMAFLDSNVVIGGNLFTSTPKLSERQREGERERERLCAAEST